MYEKSFKKTYDPQDRLYEAQRVKIKYPDRVPVIVEAKSDVPPLDKKKYLVPRDLTVGQFLYTLRKRIKLTSEKALFLFFNEQVLSPSSESIGSVYESNKDSDEFLYATLCSENTFG